MTKARVLAGLALVLAFAALNRQDTILYALAWTLAVIAALGYVLPWLALRSLVLAPAHRWSDSLEVVEGEGLDLALELHQAGWCPAWLVQVEAEWTWAGRSFVTHDTIAFLPPRSRVTAFTRARFGCRGQYRLTRLRVRSGFPLGLIEAECESDAPALTVLVRPAPIWTQLAAEWTVSDDDSDERSLSHAGESLQLNMLRAYEPGAPLRRVDWRASARAGEIIVRQFQHPASVRVKIVVELPGAKDVGRPDAMGEHAVRAAAGVCDFLARENVATELLLPDRSPVVLPDAFATALATALAGTSSWEAQLTKVAVSLWRGEQAIAVVPAGSDPVILTRAARQARMAGARLAVVIALPSKDDADRTQAASDLRDQLAGAGVMAWLLRR